MPDPEPATLSDHNESYRLLLATDVHFGDDHEFRQAGMSSALRTVGDVVADALRNEYGTEAVDALILGGDMFSRDQPHDVPRAVDGVRDFLQKVPHKVAIATPGNHDLVWDPPYTDEPFAYYNILVEATGLGDFATGRLPRAVQLTSLASHKVTIVVLDSCRLESAEMKGIGYFGPDQIDAIDGLLAGGGRPTGTKLAVFHHHVLPIWPTGQLPAGTDPRRGPAPKLSHTVDGVELLAKLIQRGFSAALHGHQHFPAVLRYENCLIRETPITVIAAGSVAMRNQPKQFFVVDVLPTELVVTSFATDPNNPRAFTVDLARPRLRIPSVSEPN